MRAHLHALALVALAWLAALTAPAALAQTPAQTSPQTGPRDEPPALTAPREILRYAVSYDGGHNAWGYEVRLYTDRNAVYSGSGLVKSAGRRRFRLSEEQYASLLNAYNYANFYRLRSPAGGDTSTRFALTYSPEGRSTTVQGHAPDRTWPRPLIRLIWATENVLQITSLACPIKIKQNYEESDVCATRAEALGKFEARP